MDTYDMARSLRRTSRSASTTPSSTATRSAPLFQHGQITLRERALAENLAQHTLIKISKLSRDMEHIPKEIKENQQAGLRHLLR